MPAPVSVFLEFNLPNATTWFYFSFLLTVALFFKFSRLVSVRNLDVVALFLMAPALLIIQGPRPDPAEPPRHPALAAAGLIAQPPAPLPVRLGVLGAWNHPRVLAAEEARWRW